MRWGCRVLGWFMVLYGSPLPVAHEARFFIFVTLFRSKLYYGAHIYWSCFPTCLPYVGPYTELCPPFNHGSFPLLANSQFTG